MFEDIYTALIILTLISFVLHRVISKTAFFRRLDLEMKQLSGETQDPYEIPYSVLPVRDNSNPLEKILQKITNNFRILITIHGILLGFIVTSQKIILVFSSWYFVIWAGLILATIIRGARLSIELSDVLEVNGNDAARRKIFAAKKFYTTSLILLIINVALLPSIFLLPENPDYRIQLGNEFHLSVASAATAIAAAFLLFYFVVFNVSDLNYSFGTFEMIAMVMMILVLGSLLYAVSPTQKVFVGFDKEIQTLPFIFVVIPIFGGLYSMFITARVVELLMMKMPPKIKMGFIEFVKKKKPFRYL